MNITMTINRKSSGNEWMHLLCGPFWQPWQCAGAIRSASLNTEDLWLSLMQLDATIGQVFASYRPGGHHGHQFWLKNWVVALWNRFPKLLSIQKAHKGSSTQLIEATSCIKRSNVTIKAKGLSFLSSYQTLTVDKKCWRNLSPMKLVKKWVVLTAHSC